MPMTKRQSGPAHESASGRASDGKRPRAADLTVYYNGGCPICSAEIDHYRRRAERSGEAIAWVDIAGDDRAEADTGLDRESLKRRLYARLPDGRLVGGVDAFEAVWDRVPGFAPLSRLLRWGPTRTMADAVYERLLAPGLVAFNGWRDRRKASERYPGR
jgi:predicted DCC family thiol-disulfide oxidoreductase YuxK